MLSCQGHPGSAFQIPWKHSLIVRTVHLCILMRNRELVPGWCARDSQGRGPRICLLGTIVLSLRSALLNTTGAGFLPLLSSCRPALPSALLAKGRGGQHPPLGVNERFLGSFSKLYFCFHFSLTLILSCMHLFFFLIYYKNLRPFKRRREK